MDLLKYVAPPPSSLCRGEQAGLTGAVVDEPSGGAGVHGVAVSVVDAQADTWGESGRRMVAQVEVWWFAAVVAAVITPQQLTVAAAIVARPRCHVRHSHR